MTESGLASLRASGIERYGFTTLTKNTENKFFHISRKDDNETIKVFNNLQILEQKIRQHLQEKFKILQAQKTFVNLASNILNIISSKSGIFGKSKNINRLKQQKSRVSHVHGHVRVERANEKSKNTKLTKMENSNCTEKTEQKQQMNLSSENVSHINKMNITNNNNNTSRQQQIVNLIEEKVVQSRQLKNRVMNLWKETYKNMKEEHKKYEFARKNSTKSRNSQTSSTTSNLTSGLGDSSQLNSPNSINCTCSSHNNSDDDLIETDRTDSFDFGTPLAATPISFLESSPTDKANKNETSNNRRKKFIINELLTTESNYISDLHLALQKYQHFAQNIDQSYKNYGKIELRPHEIEILFGNLQQIWKFHQSQLNFGRFSLECLKDDNNNIFDQITTSFIKYQQDFIQLYIQYSTNHPKASEIMVKPSVTEYFDFIQIKNNLAQSLQSLLIKPIQRMVKYSLLLKDFLLCLEFESKAWLECNEAYQKMAELPKKANDASHYQLIVWQGFDEYWRLQKNNDTIDFSAEDLNSCYDEVDAPKTGDDTIINNQISSTDFKNLILQMPIKILHRPQESTEKSSISINKKFRSTSTNSASNQSITNQISSQMSNLGQKMAGSSQKLASKIANRLNHLSVKDRHLFLFEKCIVLTKMKKKDEGIDQSKYFIKNVIPIDKSLKISRENDQILTKLPKNCQTKPNNPSLLDHSFTSLPAIRRETKTSDFSINSNRFLDEISTFFDQPNYSNYRLTLTNSKEKITFVIDGPENFACLAEKLDVTF